MSEITLHLGDCLEGMRDMVPGSVDLIFADPPFNVGKQYGNGHNDRRVDYYDWCALWIDAGFRVLKPTGTMYLMTIPRHLGKLYPMLEKHGVFINHVNWRNVSAARHPNSFWNAVQPILVYGKSAQYQFNVYAQTRPLKDLQLRWGGYSSEPKGQLLDYWDDIPFVYAGSVHHAEAILKSDTNEKLHPAQMPINLIQRAILFSTNEGDTVVEPFAGLAPGSIACLRTGRNYVGWEQNPVFVKAAEKRIAEAQMQPSLGLKVE